MHQSFKNILEKNDGAGPGFDLLRLALALLILASHAAPLGGTRGFGAEAIQALLHLIGYGHIPTHELGASVAIIPNNNQAMLNYETRGLMQPFVRSHVPMFFALSGFLVAGSAFRTKRIFPFLALRFFRIFPALCVEVVLSAIVIGAVFSTLPLHDYYSSRGFLTYFGNIIGVVQMELPGVIFSNGNVALNANLWTLPSEFHSYFILAFLIATGFIFNRKVLSILFVIMTIALFIANTIFNYYHTPVNGDVVVYYFFVGVIFFLWKEHIPYRLYLFIPCLIVTYILMFSARTIFIYPILLTYITVFIGLTNFPKIRLLQSGDYSYGIYLYGFPITQVLVEIFPALRQNFFGLFASAVFCTGFFAFLSWHLVEKRFLRLRKYFSIQSAKIAEDLHPETLAITDSGKI
jgi:peptidoglycan/LPS O-acetylase OafA/YrhL